MDSRAIKNFIDSEIASMRQERERANWSRKELGCSYVRHRVGGADGFQEVSVHDTSAIQNKDLVCNGLMGAIYPSSEQWFELTPWGQKISIAKKIRRDASTTTATGRMKNRSTDLRRVESGDVRSLDEIDGAKDAIQDIGKKVLSLFDSNGYYMAKQEQLEDAYCVGFGVMMTIYDVLGDGIRNRVYHKTFNPKECFLRQSPSGSRPMVFARVFSMTSSDIWLRWREKCPRAVLEDRRAGISNSYQIIEFICPSGYVIDAESGERLVSQQFKYLHYIYINPVSNYKGENDADSQLYGDFLEAGGFDDMPVTVLYFKKHPSHPYGISVLEECLEEIISVDDLARTIWENLQYDAEPMWAVPLSYTKSFNPEPGKIFGVADPSTQSPLAVQRPNAYAQITDFYTFKKNELKEMMWVTIFQTLISSTDTRKTATEVNYLKNEAAQIATGMIGNSRECAQEEVMRVISLLKKEKVIKIEKPEIQQVLDKAILRFNTQFINQVQNFYMLSSVTNFVNYMAGVYQLDATVIDVIDLDQTTRDVASALSMNEFNIRELSEVEQIRAQRLQMAQQEMQNQNAIAQSEVNLNNAKAGAANGTVQQ